LYQKISYIAYRKNTIIENLWDHFMKIIGINGSPRKDGNTSILLNTVFEELHKEGIETETIVIGNKKHHGCTGCALCFEKKDGRCQLPVNELFNSAIAKIAESDGVVIGSPVYFADVTAETKAFIDVAGYVNRSKPEMFRRKIGAGVIAVRRAGAIHAFDSINHLFGISEMITPGSSYWNIGMGRGIGEVLQDEEGLRTMRTLGQNIAWLTKQLNK
jgi:multimeric flavodoxin WrbA